MPADKSRPNFLFIMTDQHRADWLGCTGHPVVKTPHLDSIASRGVNFDRCYVTNPVCQPNRASLMTGRMPSSHTVRNNGIPIPLEANTFVDVLRDSGYQTALCGKAHFQNMTGKPAVMKAQPVPDRQAPSEAYAGAMRQYPGAYEQEQPASWDDPNFSMTLPYYGFEHVDLTTFHGDQVHGAWRRWLREVNPAGDDAIGPKNALSHKLTAPQAWRTAVPEEHYPSTWVADRTIDQLDAMGGKDDPFFLMMSFPDPHHPFTPPGRYFDMYSPDDMVLPPSFIDPGNNPPPTVQWAWENQRPEKSKEWGEGQFLFTLDEKHLREIMALTAGMVTMVDDAVGRVIAHLEAIGEADNTIIVFTSDHGDFLGDHRLMLKGPIHYDGLIRVPLLWADPQNANPGALSSSLVSTMDLGATVLDRAGLAPFHGMQGRSISPDLDTLTDHSTGAILIEDDQQRKVLGFDYLPRVHSIVTERYRLSIYDNTDWGEIYDLVNDPLENHNLWSEPSAATVKSQLLEQMAREHIRLVDRYPLPDQLA